MNSPWDQLTETPSESPFPRFSELYDSTSDPKTAQTQHQLELYLKLLSEGRSLLHNLRDRKEFYRPDLYTHLFENTIKKLPANQPKEPKKETDSGEEPAEEVFRPNEGGLGLADLSPDSEN